MEWTKTRLHAWTSASLERTQFIPNPFINELSGSLTPNTGVCWYHRFFLLAPPYLDSLKAGVIDPSRPTSEMRYCTIISTVFIVCNISSLSNGYDDTMNISKPERAIQVGEQLSTSITHKNCYIKRDNSNYLEQLMKLLIKPPQLIEIYQTGTETHIHMHAHMCIYTYLHTHILLYTLTHIYTHKHRDMHTHTYTHQLINCKIHINYKTCYKVQVFCGTGNKYFRLWWPEGKINIA